MAGENTVLVKLDDGETMVIVAKPVGGMPVGAKEIVANLSTIAASIERVSAAMLGAVKKAGPNKATVELGFALAIESSHVVALFGKGRGEASISVILEWSRDAAVPAAERDEPVTPALAAADS
jgi:hypothetical protein